MTDGDLTPCGIMSVRRQPTEGQPLCHQILVHQTCSFVRLRHHQHRAAVMIRYTNVTHGVDQGTVQIGHGRIVVLVVEWDPLKLPVPAIPGESHRGQHRPIRAGLIRPSEDVEREPLKRPGRRDQDQVTRGRYHRHERPHGESLLRGGQHRQQGRHMPSLLRHRSRQHRSSPRLSLRQQLGPKLLLDQLPHQWSLERRVHLRSQSCQTGRWKWAPSCWNGRLIRGQSTKRRTSGTVFWKSIS